MGILFLHVLWGVEDHFLELSPKGGRLKLSSSDSLCPTGWALVWGVLTPNFGDCLCMTVLWDRKKFLAYSWDRMLPAGLSLNSQNYPPQVWLSHGWAEGVCSVRVEMWVRETGQEPLRFAQVTMYIWTIGMCLWHNNGISLAYFKHNGMCTQEWHTKLALSFELVF